MRGRGDLEHEAHHSQSFQNTNTHATDTFDTGTGLIITSPTVADYVLALTA